jgi:hypothetical protein
MSELCELTLAEASARIQRGVLSPLELTYQQATDWHRRHPPP